MAHCCIRKSKKRLETIASVGDPTVASYGHSNDSQPLDESTFSDDAIAQDLDEIEAAAYIKMRAELDGLNKANDSYHRSHATIESGILFTEVGIRRYEALANDFQVRELYILGAEMAYALAWFMLIATQAQLDRLSQRAVYLERLVKDAESRIRESETWRMQLEEEQTQILRLKTMLQPPELKSPGGAATKSTFIRKSSLAASKKMFESGEAHSAATSTAPFSSVNPETDSTSPKKNVRQGATLINSKKSGDSSMFSEQSK